MLSNRIPFRPAVGWTNFYEYHATPVDGGYALFVGEVNRKPSMTVPDSTLSLRELVARYTRGQNVVVHEAVYTDNPLIPDNLERMDEIERREYARDLRASIKQHQMRIAQEQEQKKPAPSPVPTPPPPPPTDTPAPTPAPPQAPA